MVKVQNKTKRHVVSIETGRPLDSEGADRFNTWLLPVHRHPDCADDWNTVLTRLRTEISQIDKAIQALTQLAMGRGRLPEPVSPASEPELKEGRKTC